MGGYALAAHAGHDSANDGMGGHESRATKSAAIKAAIAISIRNVVPPAYESREAALRTLICCIKGERLILHFVFLFIYQKLQN